MHDAEVRSPGQESSWIAARVLPSAHTNPVFALVGGKPIRASRASAEWCLNAVNQCWTQKAPRIRARANWPRRSRHTITRARCTKRSLPIDRTVMNTLPDRRSFLHRVVSGGPGLGCRVNDPERSAPRAAEDRLRRRTSRRSGIRLRRHARALRRGGPRGDDRLPHPRRARHRGEVARRGGTHPHGRGAGAPAGSSAPRRVFVGQIDGATELNARHVDAMTKLVTRRVKPDIILAHWPIDTHMDHQVASLLAIRAWMAVRSAGLFFYEVNAGEQTEGFKPDTYVDITAVRGAEEARAVRARQPGRRGDLARSSRSHGGIPRTRDRRGGCRSLRPCCAIAPAEDLESESLNRTLEPRRNLGTLEPLVF